MKTNSFAIENNKKMKKDDCFLMMGSKISEPMTIYQITDVFEEAIWARNISVKQEMVFGFPVSNEYHDGIPEDAIPLPSNSWEWCKEQMISFVEEINIFLRGKIKKKTCNITLGKHYVERPGCVCTVTEIGEERIKYDLFRYDEDFISPYWSGDASLDSTDNWYTITNETYDELLRKYEEFLSRIRNKLCGV